MRFSMSIIAMLASMAAVEARDCHLESSVTSRQNNACGAGSCIPGQTEVGRATLSIDGEEVWSEGSYDSMSLGDGEDFDVDGVKGHVSALGLPARDDEPSCRVTLGDYVNLGIGDKESAGLPGISGQDLVCTHDWAC